MESFIRGLNRAQRIVVFLFLVAMYLAILLSSKLETFYVLYFVFLILSFLILLAPRFWGNKRGLISHFLSVALILGNVALLGKFEYVSPDSYWVPRAPAEPYSLFFNDNSQKDEKYFENKKENCEILKKNFEETFKNYKELCLDNVKKEQEEIEASRLKKEQRNLAYKEEIQEWVKIRKLVTPRPYFEFYENPFEEGFLFTWLLSLAFIGFLQFNYFGRKPIF